MARIELRIDRVVLDGMGVPPWRLHAVQAAIHAELTRLITAAPATSWQESRRQRLVSAPVLPLHPFGTPEAVGHGIARSVYGSLVTPPTRGAVT